MLRRLLAGSLLVNAVLVVALIVVVGTDEKPDSSASRPGSTTLPSSPGGAVPLTVTGPNPRVVVQVDCGTNGVANLSLVFGQVDVKQLIGRPSLTRAAGGWDHFEQTYSLDSSNTDVPLTVTVRPTTGSCKTTLTDYDRGSVIAERESAGQTHLTVVLSHGG